MGRLAANGAGSLPCGAVRGRSRLRFGGLSLRFGEFRCLWLAGFRVLRFSFDGFFRAAAVCLAFRAPPRAGPPRLSGPTLFAARPPRGLNNASRSLCRPNPTLSCNSSDSCNNNRTSKTSKQLGAYSNTKCPSSGLARRRLCLGCTGTPPGDQYNTNFTYGCSR